MKKDDYTRKCWLMYFNHTLADKGLISKDEYRKVKLKIDRKYHEHSQDRKCLGSVNFL